MEKRKFIVAMFIGIIIVVASAGFFEIGLEMGKTQGYNQGFSKGSESILLQTFTEIQLQPNQSFLVVTQPLASGSINLSYSFVVATPFSQPGTVEMDVSALSLLVFSTGFCSGASGFVSINATNINETPLNIIFKADSNNTSMVILDITTPLIAVVQ